MLKFDAEADREKLIEWMSPLNFFERQLDIFSNWQPGTGDWLLSDTKFKEWECATGTAALWCRGMRGFFQSFNNLFSELFLIAGAGKTVLACVVWMQDNLSTHSCIDPWWLTTSSPTTRSLVLHAYI
jgi:hypothetical protein